MLRGTLRETAAECLATFVLICFGVGVVAQVVLGQKQNGEYLSINLGWALGVTLGIYVGGGVSGAHMNPAVTLALAIFRGFPWRKVFPYIAAQLIGAFLASAVVYATYHEALDAFDGGHRAVLGDKGTAGIWATYPQPYLSLAGGLVDQIVGTALLLIVVFALGDAKNSAPQANLAPLLVGATVLAIGMTYGLNAGYAINPARDLAPRFFTYLAGWGKEVFTAGDGWWWVPIVGPMIGGVLGGFVYDLFVGWSHPQESK
jgi:MIP family channel proteins